jgi:hypothetical protein
MMAVRYRWLEEIDGARSTLMEDCRELGYVSPIGASFKVVCGIELIAIRPTRKEAKRLLWKVAEVKRKK